MLTREEKERIFLDALQSYYYNGKSNLPDEQFNRCGPPSPDTRHHLNPGGCSLTIAHGTFDISFLYSFLHFICSQKNLFFFFSSFLSRRLKEDLSWEGSVLVNLNRNETKFLEAKQAYNTGTSFFLFSFSFPLAFFRFCN